MRVYGLGFRVSGQNGFRVQGQFRVSGQFRV